MTAACFSKPVQRQAESEDADQDESELDSRRSFVVNAIDFAIAKNVDSWNSRPQPGKFEVKLARPQVVHLWKKSNTRGGDFKQKRLNHVSRATLSYEQTSCQLTVTLYVVEGEPNDAAWKLQFSWGQDM